MSQPTLGQVTGPGWHVRLEVGTIGGVPPRWIAPAPALQVVDSAILVEESAKDWHVMDMNSLLMATALLLVGLALRGKK